MRRPARAQPCSAALTRRAARRYATLERRLGEIDRARAIYTYASQFCNPKVGFAALLGVGAYWRVAADRRQVDIAFWKVWHDFEVQHGNRDTFKEMLRIRRSVTNQFAQTNFIATATSMPGLVRRRALAQRGAGEGPWITRAVRRRSRRARRAPPALWA